MLVALVSGGSTNLMKRLRSELRDAILSWLLRLSPEIARSMMKGMVDNEESVPRRASTKRQEQSCCLIRTRTTRAQSKNSLQPQDISIPPTAFIHD